MGVLVDLGVTDPVPALNAPSVPHLLQQGFWGGEEARQKQVGGLKRPVTTGAADREFHDPAGADIDLADVLRGLLGAQRSGDFAAVANLVIPCDSVPQKGSCASAGTEIGSDDAMFSGCPSWSAGSRPSAPRAT